jgi:glucose-6-phosphate 1-dehydrogenase
MTASQSDALVLIGVTGDLAHKMIFPALYAMAKQDALKVPVIGVAAPKWSLADLRNVIQNHLFQVVALLAMEPPAYRGFAAVHNEKAKVFQAMRPLEPDDLVCGQYAEYRKTPNVAKDSDVETFCALRLFIDSWRWKGVRWYLRSGKCLPENAKYGG